MTVGIRWLIVVAINARSGSAIAQAATTSHSATAGITCSSRTKTRPARPAP